MGIGRDLVRIFQDVSKIPEFEQLWKDMLLKPASFSPNFTGVAQLTGIRTPRMYTYCNVILHRVITY